jgi:hypothetical protein
MLCGAVCEPGCAFVVWSQWEGSFCAVHCFGQAVRHVPVASREGCHLHTTPHLFKRHILYAISGVSWGHGGGGRVGGGGRGRVPWFGKAGSRTWVDGCGPPSSPLCVVGSLTCPIGEPAAHWLVCSHASTCRMHAVAGGGVHGEGGGIGRKRKVLAGPRL